jgi:hypothetical protein
MFKGAGITHSVERRAASWTAGVRFPAGARDFSVLHSIQSGSGAHPASNEYLRLFPRE